MPKKPRLRQFFLRRFRHIPIRVVIVGIVIIIFIGRYFSLRTFIFIKNSKNYPHDEAGEVSFPRNMVVDGIFRINTPNQTAVKENH